MDKEVVDPNLPEEEYHFGEPESGPVTYSEAAKTVKTKRTKISFFWLFVVCVLLAFVIYKLFDILVLSRAHRASTTTTTTTVVPPPIPKPQVIAPAPSISPAVNQRIENLEQKTDANEAALNRLTTQVSDMQTTLTDLTTQINNIGDGVLAINAKIAAHEAALAERARRVRRVRVRPLPVFFVKAMVQGRAWVVTEGGHVLTVGVGSGIPGYGIVRIIDPQNGTITMSSGAIIGYSPDDM